MDIDKIFFYMSAIIDSAYRSSSLLIPDQEGGKT